MPCALATAIDEGENAAGGDLGLEPSIFRVRGELPDDDENMGMASTVEGPTETL